MLSLSVCFIFSQLSFCNDVGQEVKGVAQKSGFSENPNATTATHTLYGRT